jgi:hypothetical protein
MTKLRNVWTIIIFCSAIADAQDMAVPMNVQVPLLLKILTFNRAQPLKTGDEVVIGIVYQGRFRTSLNAKDEFLKEMGSSSTMRLHHKPIRCLPIDLGDAGDLAGAMAGAHVDFFYVTPLRAVAMDIIAGVSHAKKIVTLTGVPDYVEAGLAVGIDSKGEKPLIVINIKAAKAESADFSSQLLKLSKVIE